MATTKLTLGETKTLSSGVIALCYQRAKKLATDPVQPLGRRTEDAKTTSATDAGTSCATDQIT